MHPGLADRSLVVLFLRFGGLLLLFECYNLNLHAIGRMVLQVFPGAFVQLGATLYQTEVTRAVRPTELLVCDSLPVHTINVYKSRREQATKHNKPFGLFVASGC